jgi:hypothetical protein
MLVIEADVAPWVKNLAAADPLGRSTPVWLANPLANSD